MSANYSTIAPNCRFHTIRCMQKSLGNIESNIEWNANYFCMINTKQFRNILFLPNAKCAFPGDQSKREHSYFCWSWSTIGFHLLKPHIYNAKLPCIYRANLVWIKLFKTQSENYLRRIFVHALEVFFFGGGPPWDVGMGLIWSQLTGTRGEGAVLVYLRSCSAKQTGWFK